MDLHSGSPWETLTLTTLSRDRELFPRLLAEARLLAQQSEEGKTVVYTAWGVEWRPFGKPRRVRHMQSVVLDQGVGEDIEHDLRTFMGRGKWYAERGASPPPPAPVLPALWLARADLWLFFALGTPKASRTGGATCCTARPGRASRRTSRRSPARSRTTSACSTCLSAG